MRHTLIALLLLAVSAPSAIADSAVVDRLRGESASLWDIGVMRLRLQAQDAAREMTMQAAGKTTNQVAFHPDVERLIVEFRVLNPISATTGACNRYRRNAIENLTGASSGSTSGERARVFLGRIFTPTRHFGEADPEGFGAKLAEMTDVTVRLGKDGRTVCTGGIADWWGEAD